MHAWNSFSTVTISKGPSFSRKPLPRARSVVTTDRTDTIVAGRFPIAEVLKDLLAVADHVPLVEEVSIKAGMRLLYRHAGVVEPSAALGVAAILEDPSRYRGKRVVTVICGSNVLPETFSAWTQD